MLTDSTPKFASIRRAIEKDIRWGRYRPKDRLPAEKQLAVQYGVSYMTARRAVTELVEANVLSRRVGAGIFVRDDLPNRLTLRNVHIICHSNENSLTKSYLRICGRQCSELDVQADIIRYDQRTADLVISVISRGEPALILAVEQDLHGRLGEALKETDGQAVLIGNRMDRFGVSSVLADDAQAARMAIDYLRANGHANIGLIVANPNHSVSTVQIAAWKDCFNDVPSEILSSRMIPVDVPSYSCGVEFGYEQIRRYLIDAGHQGNRPTAFFCCNDELALSALAACRDEGCPCPEKISIVCACDSPQMAYGEPPVTVTDVNLEQHIELALAMLTARLAGPLQGKDILRIVAPRLIERQSVAHLNIHEPHV